MGKCRLWNHNRAAICAGGSHPEDAAAALQSVWRKSLRRRDSVSSNYGACCAAGPPTCGVGCVSATPNLGLI